MFFSQRGIFSFHEPHPLPESPSSSSEPPGRWPIIRWFQQLDSAWVRQPIRLQFGKSLKHRHRCCNRVATAMGIVIKCPQDDKTLLLRVNLYKFIQKWCRSKDLGACSEYAHSRQWRSMERARFVRKADHTRARDMWYDTLIKMIRFITAEYIWNST